MAVRRRAGLEPRSSAYGGRLAASPAIGFVAKDELDGPGLRALIAERPADARLPRRRIGLAAIGVLALVGGPFATSQLTHTAERSPALLLADLAVGWSMIAAILLIADRPRATGSGPLRS